VVPGLARAAGSGERREVQAAGGYDDTYVSCRATACGEPGPRFALAIDRARVNSPYCAGGVEVPKAPPADRQLIATRDEIDVDSATEAERVRHSLYALYVLAES